MRWNVSRPFYFVTFLDEAQGEKQKETIRNRVKEYLARAEKIKVHVEDSKNNKKKPMKENGNGKDKGSDSDEEDTQTKKLQVLYLFGV